MKTQHVVVVGGGLIGLSTAYALLRDGHRVTIIDRDRLGSGAAKGNAGELTPQQVGPLASPHTAKDIIRGVFTRTSYLSIEPLQLPRLALFGLGFLRASGATRSARGAAALAQFSGEILPSLQRMAADGIDVSGGGDGYLMTSSVEAELQAAHASYRRRAEKGWGEAPGAILRGTQLADQEPALASGVAAGFMLPGEFSLDPITFVESLIAHLKTNGAEIREGLTAERLGDGASVVCRAFDGSKTTIRGDKLVLAAGAWTTPILRKSRVRSAPVVSGKGYSFTVPVEQMPNTLVHSMDRHCVAIPMHGRLRIVGMMEFGSHPEHLNRQKLEVLTRAASGVISGADWQNRTEEWVGARPMTADGMPLLGAIPNRHEVLVAAGHNMHGLSLGPVTGEVLADLVAGREPVVAGKPLDLRPFAINR
ncbi:FAD-binding oxidoreductase [Leucobacter viscericola]|uniref:FAD-binding oxidoreductase n=1 Tax=Leucobacter viscericola TaxID=2714935 RepID=A0A6G7XDR0_9MICO|nr:FAD-binding oxidoreductase [Leucobacter viscericola]QIK62705.1 FAD-binding oxidoreductase [Leucobacter viscericola]